MKVSRRRSLFKVSSTAFTRDGLTFRLADILTCHSLVCLKIEEQGHFESDVVQIAGLMIVAPNEILK